MPMRYLCYNCRVTGRRGRACATCGRPPYPVEVRHTAYGALMFVFAAIGGLMILGAFVITTLMVLYSFVPLAVAVVFNVLDDRGMDKIAAGMLPRAVPPGR